MANTKYSRQREKVTPPHAALGVVRAVSGKTLDQVCELFTEATGHPLTRGALSAIENGHRGASEAVLRGLEMAYGVHSGAFTTTYEPRVRAAEVA